MSPAERRPLAFGARVGKNRSMTADRPRSEHLRFPGAFGDTLAARLDRPGGEARAYALFAHCFTCGKDLRTLGRISAALVDRGIAVLRFDFTGIGESAGDFSRTNFSSNLDDLRAAAAFMRAELEAPSLLLGHSLGGAAVIAVARDIPEVVAVATLAAPADTRRFRTRLTRSVPELESRGEGELSLGGGRFRIRRQLLDDLDAYAMERHVTELGRPLLVFHSTADTTVDIDQGLRLFALARQPKSFVALDGADHLLLADERDAPYVGAVLAAWADRYLDPPPAG